MPDIKIEHLECKSLLEDQYPRIIQSIDIVWSYPKEFDQHMSKLEIDDRGKRSGWPLKVWTELQYIRNIHDITFGTTVDSDSWSHIES